MLLWTLRCCIFLGLVATGSCQADSPTTGPKPINILFLGNSHTHLNNVPALVKSLLESDQSGRKVQVASRAGAVLNEIAKDQEALQQVQAPGWDIVVLQGAMMSQSHKYNYLQDGAITLAKLAKQAGARVLFFAEWPRKGWDESDFIANIYRGIAAASGGAEVVPICYTWPRVLRRYPKADLWLYDGNHTNITGAYLAAGTLYYQIAGTSRDPSWFPTGIKPEVAQYLLNTAKETVVETAKTARKAGTSVHEASRGKKAPLPVPAHPSGR